MPRRSGPELNAIRDQLVALDIEKRWRRSRRSWRVPSSRADMRADGARSARASARRQRQLDAAEKDYRAILQLRAGYVPARDVTSKKAMDRFQQDSGFADRDRSPRCRSEGAHGGHRRWTPGRRVGGECRVAAVVAGSAASASRTSGFDPQDVSLRAVAGQETLARIRMVPNARGLVHTHGCRRSRRHVGRGPVRRDRARKRSGFRRQRSRRAPTRGRFDRRT